MPPGWTGGARFIRSPPRVLPVNDPLADPDLETMRPNPAWDAAAYDDVVDTLADATVTYRVWGGDWCPDCRQQLPDFAAALDAADVSAERLHVYPVERGADGKVGEKVEAYDVDRIPTVVVEDDDGSELDRFVENEPVPVAVYVADLIDDSE